MPFAPPARPVPIILDTDIGPDCDDAGAIAVLNALADLGEAKLLAMTCCTSSDGGAPCIQAINTYYGRPDIPIGTYKRTGFLPYSKYDSHVAAEFPNTLKTGAAAPDAIAVLRQTLAAQPDGSVVMVAIGPLNNLADLLKSEPDAHSPMTGHYLVARKVRLFVDMGGGYPGGGEWNFQQDIPAAQHVADHWPSPIIFSGLEIGLAIHTGKRLCAEAPPTNPVRRAYELYTGGELRPSWDQTAALCAVRGAGVCWELGHGGRCHVNADGSNEWREEAPARHTYLIPKMPIPEVARYIEDLMLRPPAHGRH